MVTVWRGFKCAVPCYLAASVGILSPAAAVVVGCVLFVIVSVHAEDKAQRKGRI